MKCPLCNRVYISSAVGIKLYQSENECAICMTKGKTMLALPCGHQFCEEDLKKIGITVQPPTPPVSTPNVPPNPPRRTIVIQRPSSAIDARRSLFMANRRRRQRLRELEMHRRDSRMLPVATPSSSSRSRTSSSSRSRKRCGWCGHIGHTIQKCRQHTQQCGCRAGRRTNSHKVKLRRKHRCVICGKRGHNMSSCHIIMSR